MSSCRSLANIANFQMMKEWSYFFWSSSLSTLTLTPFCHYERKLEAPFNWIILRNHEQMLETIDLASRLTTSEKLLNFCRTKQRNFLDEKLKSLIHLRDRKIQILTCVLIWSSYLMTILIKRIDMIDAELASLREGFWEYQGSSQYKRHWSKI